MRKNMGNWLNAHPAVEKQSAYDFIHIPVPN